MRYTSKAIELVERYGLVALLLAVAVFFRFNSATPQFGTSANITNILTDQSMLGILAIATVIPLVAGQIDLSLGPIAGFSGVVCAGLMSKSGWSLGAAIVAAIVLGLAIGTLNGLLVAKAGIPSIIATLGMASVISALVLAYSDGLSITTGISSKLIGLGAGNWLGLPKLFYFFVLCAIAVWYVLERTPAGKDLYALGSSPRAALLVGIRVPRSILRAHVIAGGIAGGAGVLLVANVGSGTPQLGPNYTLPAIAAAFLGATTIQPGRYNVWGTVAAVYFLAVSVNGLTLWGASPWVNQFFDGAALIVGVGFGLYAGSLRRRGVGGARTATPRDPEPPPTDQAQGTNGSASALSAAADPISK
jgi:ribose transport system permease protein